MIKKHIHITLFFLIISYINIFAQDPNKLDTIQNYKSERIIHLKLDEKVYEILQPNTRNNNLFELILTVFFPSIASIIGFIVMKNNVKKQLKTSQEHFKKAIDITFIKDFNDTLAQIIVLLNPSNIKEFKNLKNKGFISKEHELLHSKIVLLLDENVPLEKDFINQLIITNTETSNISNNLHILKEKGNQIIIHRKNYIYATI